MLDITAVRHLAMNAAVSVLRNHEDAEDATQNAMIRILGYSVEDDPEVAKAQIITIAQREAYRVLRWRAALKRVQPTTMDPAASIWGRADANPETIARARQRRHLIQKAVGTLSRRTREAVELHYFQEMSFDEVAKNMRVAKSTVQIHIERARTRLRELLLDVA